MRRRDFIAALGSAAALPVGARAQQHTLPVVGVLAAGTFASGGIAAFNQGLAETGYVDGRNVTVEFRSAGTRVDQLPGLAADLVYRQVSVIFAIPTSAALAAKAATDSIPIVFLIGADPVESGLVVNLNRPGGNLTGTSTLNLEAAAKRLQLLHEWVPNTVPIASLVNLANKSFAAAETRELQFAARTLGRQLLVLNASNQGEIATAFATLAREHAGALVVSSDQLFLTNGAQVVSLAARDRLPVIYAYREIAAAGGLMGYGADLPGLYRLVGTYVGRILKGTKPGDLPVQRSTEIDLVLNLKTAKALGLEVPTSILLRANEVIE
jgi:putative tryptophan/tyrosine transport system substrate-binding protein